MVNHEARKPLSGPFIDRGTDSESGSDPTSIPLGWIKYTYQIAPPKDQ